MLFLLPVSLIWLKFFPINTTPMLTKAHRLNSACKHSTQWPPAICLRFKQQRGWFGGFSNPQILEETCSLTLSCSKPHRCQADQPLVVWCTLSPGLPRSPGPPSYWFIRIAQAGQGDSCLALSEGMSTLWSTLASQLNTHVASAPLQSQGQIHSNKTKGTYKSYKDTECPCTSCASTE